MESRYFKIENYDPGKTLNAISVVEVGSSEIYDLDDDGSSNYEIDEIYDSRCVAPRQNDDAPSEEDLKHPINVALTTINKHGNSDIRFLVCTQCVLWIWWQSTYWHDGD